MVYILTLSWISIFSIQPDNLLMIFYTDNIIFGTRAREKFEDNIKELLRIKSLSMLTCRNIRKADDPIIWYAFIATCHNWLNQLK